MNALLISALNLLSGQRHNLATFLGEYEARHWLVVERQRLGACRSKGSGA